MGHKPTTNQTKSTSSDDARADVIYHSRNVGSFKILKSDFIFILTRRTEIIEMSVAAMTLRGFSLYGYMASQFNGKSLF